MISKDDFYKAFAETAPTPEPAPAAPDEVPEKDSYTRAEVEELVNRKIEEILKGENDNDSNEGNEGNEGNNNENGGNDNGNQE